MEPEGISPEDIVETIDLDEAGPCDEMSEMGGDVAPEEITEQDLPPVQGEKRENFEGEIQDDSLASFRAHTDSVFCVDIHPENPAMVVSGGGDDVAYLWTYDLTTRGSTPLCKLEGHTDSVVGAAFNFDGKLWHQLS
eukprot:TRINITY_DN1875_c0_g1_i1.p2 TRINITY_DN1875_c0_g1~~TRINITY_DN1875_c0_g1_i1.p2  ORF type:complete len:137 (+),score=21.61 TRINITY_DN1875_c0_g1_i1:64-474(+)